MKRGTAEWIKQFENQPELGIADQILLDHGRPEPDTQLFEDVRRLVANKILHFARTYVAWDRQSRYSESYPPVLDGGDKDAPGFDAATETRWQTAIYELCKRALWLAFHACKAMDFKVRYEGEQCLYCKYEGMHGKDCMIAAALNAMKSSVAAPQGEQAPIPYALNCPKCNCPHIDEGEWATRLHKTHRCQNCGHEWRPFEYATVGVKEVAALAKPEPQPAIERELLEEANIIFENVTHSPEEAWYEWITKKRSWQQKYAHFRDTQ